MINNIKFEVCISNAEDAIIASKYPIDRIELVTNIEVGGLTPNIETIKYLKQNISTPICCMDRSRGGDYCYTQSEKEAMLIDAKNMLDAGADGIVFGFINRDNTVDIEYTKKMVSLIHSYNKEAVFHRAFDVPKDIENTIQLMIELQVDRVLTSGQAPFENIIDGAKDIKQINEKYGDKIQILFGGGVRISNVNEIINISNVKQIHATSKHEVDGKYRLDEKQLQEFIEQLKRLTH